MRRQSGSFGSPFSKIEAGAIESLKAGLAAPNSELLTANFRDEMLRTPNSGLRTLSPKGFTLIEIILVLSIIGILAATVAPKFDSAISTKAPLDGAASMIASDIRYAQEFAMANRVSKSVTFAAGSTVYAFNPAHGLDPSAKLPSGVTIQGNFIVTFNSLGEPTAGGGGSVTVSKDGQTKTITVVNYTGKVNIS